jgi:HlyD family secretion protein
MTTTSALAREQTEAPVRRIDDADSSPRTEKHDARWWERVRRRHMVGVAVLVCASLSLVAAVASLRSDATRANADFVYSTVQRSDLPITITERGTIESQKNVEILCEVEDVQGDGINGTPILWIIDNGVSVKKGDLLVELDAAPHQERLDSQVLSTEQARAKEIQARTHWQNRQSRNETSEAKAKLDVDLAGLALRQYEDEFGGTYQIQLQDVELLIQEQEAQKAIDDRNLTGMKYLSDLGYKSKGDLAQAELQALRAESGLKRQQARRRELTVYEYEKKRLVLEGALATATRTLEQVKVENDALLEQAAAWKDSAQLSLKTEEERLVRYREQLGKCKIYSPQNGMVAYYVEDRHWGGQSAVIKAGTALRERQPLMSIPNLSRMQVKMAVHESVVDRVKPGLTGTIRLDAFPDRVYRGTVESVAVLPDPGNWLSSDTKVYETIVTIDQEVEQLKPGMTAVTEIHMDYLPNVLCVPVQAIVQQRSETWCYIADGGLLTRRDLKLGQTNDKFVEVREGLQEGDQLVLNPAAVLGDVADKQDAIGPETKSPDVEAVE